MSITLSSSTRIKFLCGALAVALTALGVVWFGKEHGRYARQNWDHAEVMTSRSIRDGEKTLSVLFVGNSFTFFNDMPAMLVNLAASDCATAAPLVVRTVTAPGATLDHMMHSTDALKWANTQHFYYVVLQEWSGWYETGEDYSQGFADILAWRRAVLALDERPVLFEVWADAPGSPHFADPQSAAYGMSPEQAAANAALATQLIATELGMPVAKVGEAFEQARHRPGAPDLYDPDLHHPSTAGSYLAALVFYRALTGRSGEGAHYRPDGVDAGQRVLLLDVAKAVVPEALDASCPD
jgi:hypothetical protein